MLGLGMVRVNSGSGGVLLNLWVMPGPQDFGVLRDHPLCKWGPITGVKRTREGGRNQRIIMRLLYPVSQHKQGAKECTGAGGRGGAEAEGAQDSCEESLAETRKRRFRIMMFAVFFLSPGGLSQAFHGSLEATISCLLCVIWPCKDRDRIVTLD